MENETTPEPACTGRNRLDATSTLVNVLSDWAEVRPDRPAFTFTSQGHEETWSFAELDRRARSIASELVGRGLVGERVLLAYPTGLEFVEAFFGCLYAGATAVPVPPGRGKPTRARLAAIIRDARPKAIFTTRAYAPGERDDPASNPCAGLIRLYNEELTLLDEPPKAIETSDPDALAFLQYTSGSTAEPKGTAISHGNILANQRMLAQAFGTSASTVVVSWLPLFHDMGLIGMVLHGAYLGAHVVLLSTVAVMKEPLAWLRAVERFRGTFSAAPNFAFDLCVARTSQEERATLDLGSWATVVNGSEPVRRTTALRFTEAFRASGFRPTSFAPAYGLAEATLLVSGQAGRNPTFLELDGKRLQEDEVARPRDAVSTRWLVGCGPFTWGDQVVKVVDPSSLTERRDGEIGEIWIAGSHVAAGYFENPAATAERFGARLPDDERRYLRTGDLGFVRDGELFITGRIKDLVIVRGQKFYPQDVELTVEEASPRVRRGSVAAFGVDSDDGQDLVVVAEVERREYATPELAAELAQAIRAALDVPLREVCLAGKGAVHKTTSGKLQRHRCRQAYVSGELATYTRWRAPLSGAPSFDEELQARVEAHACRWLAERRGLEPSAAEAALPFTVLGLDSISRLELIRSVEKEFGRVVPESAAHALETVAELARLVATTPSPSSEPQLVPRTEDEATPQDRGVILPAFAPLSWDQER